MTRGKRLIAPSVVVTCIDEPKFASSEEAWEDSGQLLARILAKAMKENGADQKCHPTANQNLNDVPTEQAD